MGHTRDAADMRLLLDLQHQVDEHLRFWLSLDKATSMHAPAAVVRETGWGQPRSLPPPPASSLRPKLAGVQEAPEFWGDCHHVCGEGCQFCAGGDQLWGDQLCAGGDAPCACTADSACALTPAAASPFLAMTLNAWCHKHLGQAVLGLEEALKAHQDFS